MTQTRPPTIPGAEKTGVKAFRLILQWPLVLDDAGNLSARQADDGGRDWIAGRLKTTRRALAGSGVWAPVRDVLNYPVGIAPRDTDGGGYAQFAYFHDFAQDFLFPRPDAPDRAFDLYERTDLAGFEVLPDGTRAGAHLFEIDRLSLHLFDVGSAVVTLELNWTGRGCCDDGSKPETPLTLADCQTLIDLIRRSYTPFWEGDEPARVAQLTILRDRDGQEVCNSWPLSRDEANARLNDPDNRQRDIEVFRHWQEIIRPLDLQCLGGCWRDPADERMPINSFIALHHDSEKEQQAVSAIAESDWFRLADAEVAGKGYPYNRDFLRDQARDVFYDRFAPDSDCGICATRHVFGFGGMHYSVVGAGWFMENVILHHFRRHYTLLSLVARFEFTALMAISSRLSRAVARLKSTGNRFDDEAFENEVIAIQGDFLNFVHRFRFTGISSQFQAQDVNRHAKLTHLGGL